MKFLIIVALLVFATGHPTETAKDEILISETLGEDNVIMITELIGNTNNERLTDRLEIQLEADVEDNISSDVLNKTLMKTEDIITEDMNNKLLSGTKDTNNFKNKDITVKHKSENSFSTQENNQTQNLPHDNILQDSESHVRSPGSGTHINENKMLSKKNILPMGDSDLEFPSNIPNMQHMFIPEAINNGYAQKSQSANPNINLIAQQNKELHNVPVEDWITQLMPPKIKAMQSMLHVGEFPNKAFSNNIAYENMNINDYADTQYINSQYALNDDNDYLYDDNYPLEMEYQDSIDHNYKINSFGSHNTFEKLSGYEPSMSEPTRNADIQIQLQNEFKIPDKFVSTDIPTYYRPVGRVVVYEIHKPFFKHLRNIYKEKNKSEALRWKYDYEGLSQKEENTDLTNRGKVELSKYRKTDKRNADKIKYGIKDSVLTKSDFPLQTRQYNNNAARRYDTIGPGIYHNGRDYHSSGNYGYAPYPSNLYGLSRGRGGFPYGFSLPQNRHYGDLSGRELRQIMHRVFGI